MIVIIRNDDNSDSKDGIFTGTRYFGNKQYHRKSSSGWLNTYFVVPQKSKICSLSGKRKIQERAKVLGKFLCHTSGSSSIDERCLLLTEFLKSNKELTKQAITKAGFKIIELN